MSPIPTPTEQRLAKEKAGEEEGEEGSDGSNNLSRTTNN